MRILSTMSVTLTILFMGAAYGETVFDPTHSRWARVVGKYVTTRGPVSEVAYGELKKNAKDLDAYLQEISSVRKEEFQILSRDQQLAFLINAYNAFTVKLVLDHYPLKSIKDVGGILSSPWKKRFFTLFGKRRHLDDIEHGMMRKDRKAFDALEDELRTILKPFDDPRVHFALNCASKGCPALRGEPYLASQLGRQLEDATRMFLRDSGRNRFDPKRSVLELSNLFKWYREDFEKVGGSVHDFIASRMASSPAEEVEIRQAKLTFLDYDWTLNGI